MGTRHYWNEEQDQFLLDNCHGTPRKVLREMFNEHFNLELSLSSIENRMKKVGAYNGVNDGCFKKGSVPFNKGRKMVEWMKPEMIERSAKTRFKKGQKPSNLRKVGDERTDTDGYTLVKVDNCKKWKLKHRIIYEQAHNIKLKPRQKVMFLDGNKKNFDIDNLVLITDNEMARLNHEHLLDSNPDITKVNLDIVRVESKIRERRGSK